MLKKIFRSSVGAKTTLLLSCVIVATLVISINHVYAGGGGNSGGSSSNTNAATRDVMGTTQINGRQYEVSQWSDRIGPSLDPVDRSRGNDRVTGTGPGVGKTPTPVSQSCANKNLTTIDIFFVPTGAQPTPAPARRSSFFGNSSLGQLLGTVNPYRDVMIASNQLQVGESYDPIAQIRNSASCSSNSNSGQNGRGGEREKREIDVESRSFLFNIINTAYAGSGGSRRPNDYPNNVRNQLPFGSNGSFPIRARIDVGNNTIIDWEAYQNAVGPLNNGQTTYVRLPAFTTTEVGTHSIEIITDIRHSIDPGKGCYADTTPDSVGWGCVRETSERDNDRRETFTTVGSSTLAGIRVEVEDITMPARSVLTEVPFTVINNGVQTINGYRYTVQVRGTQFANTNRTTTLTPTQRELVSASGRYTVPNTNTTVPITVCAQVGTSTQSCDSARLIVTTPQCSDGRDNDADSTADSRDTGCLTDPLDPSSYDPDDNSESDGGTLPAPNITLEAENKFVRSNNATRVTYSIQAAYRMTCQLRGPGINDTFSYTSGVIERTVSTAALINKQSVSLSCTPSGFPAGSYQPTTREITIEIIPQVQEV